MGVRPGWHVRSLRMPEAEAAAIVEAVRRLRESQNKRISQQEFIRQCVRYVVREAGIAVPEPEPAEIEEDPFE